MSLHKPIETIRCWRRSEREFPRQSVDNVRPYGVMVVEIVEKLPSRVVDHATKSVKTTPHDDMDDFDVQCKSQHGNWNNP